MKGNSVIIGYLTPVSKMKFKVSDSFMVTGIIMRLLDDLNGMVIDLFFGLSNKNPRLLAKY